MQIGVAEIKEGVFRAKIEDGLFYHAEIGDTEEEAKRNLANWVDERSTYFDNVREKLWLLGW